MTETEAKRLIIVATVVASLLAVVAQLVTERELPPVRTGIGVFVAALLLSLLAEASPRVAGGMAALLLTSAVLTLGPQVIGATNRTVRK